MKQIGLMKLVGVLALAAGVTACGSQGDGEGTRQGNEEAGEVVASLRLSPTHYVEFIDYGSVANVHEVLHADSDRDAPRTLEKLQAGDLPISEIYQRFAESEADAAIVTKLRLIEARIARGELETNPHGVLKIPAAPSEAAGGERIDRVQQGILPSSCAEPAWNWAGDATWYRNNFCTGSPAFCSTNSFGKLSWGWDGPLKRFQATVFNQSHCAPQGWWQLLWRNNTGTHQPTNTVICPRCVQGDVWSGGSNVQYFNSMEPREQGKMVSMTIYRTPQ